MEQLFPYNTIAHLLIFTLHWPVISLKAENMASSKRYLQYLALHSPLILGQWMMNKGIIPPTLYGCTRTKSDNSNGCVLRRVKCYPYLIRIMWRKLNTIPKLTMQDRILPSFHTNTSSFVGYRLRCDQDVSMLEKRCSPAVKNWWTASVCWGFTGWEICVKLEPVRLYLLDNTREWTRLEVNGEQRKEHSYLGMLVSNTKSFNCKMVRIK